jgi:DNA-binding transcriptional ArsR family regulator
MRTTMTLRDPAVIAAATHPARAAILDAMRSPTTAAAAARAIGQSRQNVAYHARELERVGLLRGVGQRQNGNFVEQVYQVVAQTLVISPESVWGDPQPRARALADQLSLGEVEAGARLQRESALLLDKAAFDGEEISSVSVATEIHFASPQARVAFLREYLDLLTGLAGKYGSRGGAAYRLLLAAYPNPEKS